MFRASVGVAACSLLLMFFSRGQDFNTLPAAFLSADSFVGAAFKTSAFYLVHSIVTPMCMKPTLSEQEKAAVGRRSALVLLAYELVSFSLLAYRFRQLPSAAAMSASAAVSSQTVTSCATCHYLCVLRFASLVMCAHTLLIAAIVGMGAAVLARAENQDMVTSVREACNARLASMPSACQIIGRVCTSVCAPALPSSSSAASASSASKCPFAAFASASSAKCPFSGASSSTAAAESASATVAPVASSSAAAPAAACPFRTASCFAVKARMILTCAGSCAVAALYNFVKEVRHAPELNASPSEQRRAAELHHRSSQPLSPVPEVSTPASPAAPTPSATSSVVTTSPVVESTVAASAPEIAPEPEVAAAPVSDSAVSADSAAAASLPSSASASSVSPDDEDGFEFVEKNEQ